MKYFVMVLIVILLVVVSGCFGGGGVGSELMGQMPQGYDIYITIDPEAMDLAGILENIKDILPEEVLDEIGNMDLDMEFFRWNEWKEELGILDGEIGIIFPTEDASIVAFFLPCGDGSRLKEFIEDKDFRDTEFFSYGEYTVMVVTSGDDYLLDNFGEALENEPLFSDDDYAAMRNACEQDNSCMAFMFSAEVTDLPIYGVFSIDNTESVLKVAAAADNDELELYLGIFGEGLQSRNIKFPEHTMAALRCNLNTGWLAAEYGNIVEKSGNNGLEEIQEGLPFIGFSSLEEFLSVFQGDFCLAIRGIELNSNGSLECVFAISLVDSETFLSSISTMSLMAEATVEDFGNFTASRISNNDRDIWVFIEDDVFYVSVNVAPEDIIDGVSAGDYFSDGVASEGFMGGAVNTGEILEGILAEDDVEEIIAVLVGNGAVFSVSVRGKIFVSTFIAGPGIFESFVSTVSAIGYCNEIQAVEIPGFDGEL